MAIRIDALDPTVNPQRDHEFPAMRSALTVKLTVAQILGLIEAGDLPSGVLASLALADSALQSVADGSVTAVKLAADVASSLAPPGCVAHFAMNAPPTGWLKANGAAVSRTTYAALFTAIGTTFGTGDGSTTFNVPDLRGEFTRGWDDGRGVDTARAFGSAQADEFKSHTHAQDATTIRTTVGAAVNVDGSVGRATGGTTAATGGTETRPRNIALLACIKF
jgi:microcystin-dependent protein